MHEISERRRSAGLLRPTRAQHPSRWAQPLGSVSIRDDNWRKSSFPAKNEYFPSQTPTSRETRSLGALHRFPSCPACHAHGPVPVGQSRDPTAQGFAPKGLRGGNPLKILSEVRAGKASGAGAAYLWGSSGMLPVQLVPGWGETSIIWISFGKNVF